VYYDYDADDFQNVIKRVGFFWGVPGIDGESLLTTGVAGTDQKCGQSARK
jgi:hypothetical protein